MRRFTRYSIRSLLVLVTLTCVVLGWYAMNVQAYRAERAALARLEQIQGLIGVEIDGARDSRLHPWCATGVFGYATMEQTSPLGVHHLLGSYGEAFLRVQELRLSGYVLHPEAVTELTRFSHLSRLSIDGPIIKPPDRARIQSLLPSTQVEFTEWPEAEKFSWSSHTRKISSGYTSTPASAEEQEESPFEGDPSSSDENPFRY